MELRSSLCPVVVASEDDIRGRLWPRRPPSLFIMLLADLIVTVAGSLLVVDFRE